MAIILHAVILCDTDNPRAAHAAVQQALESEVHQPESPVLDFALGIEQVLEIAGDYAEGSFVARVPAAAMLKAGNSLHLPS